MKVMVDFCLVPIGVGVSLSPYIAECEKIIRKTSLKSSLHPYGTIIEGDWDEVFEIVKTCHKKVHEMGAPRITTTLKLGTRSDKEQNMEEKIQSVESKL